MNESGFIRSVNQHLPGAVYQWKIADRFTAGVPDTWYAGNKGSIFIEYKLLKTVPKRSFTPKLSSLQRAWLRARYTDGVDVAVIIGMPRGGVVLTDLAWDGRVNMSDCTFLTKKEIAEFIKTRTVTNEHH